jgi:hypothetical protein
VLASGHGAVFVTVGAAGLVVSHVLRGVPIALVRRLRDVGIAGALLLVPVMLVYLPYLRVQEEMGLRRTLDAWGVVPQSFIASPSHVWQAVLSVVPGGTSVNATAAAFLFPGVLPLGLAIAALVARRTAGTTIARADVVFFAVLTLVCVWLAIGPPFGLWQFVYWLPGLSFIREASRFTILGMLGLAILAGVGCQYLTMNRRWVPALVALLLLVEFAAFPLVTVDGPAPIPAIDRWLDAQPKPFVVAEVPLPHPSQAGPFERQQTDYMIHSTAHWQRTVHGYSGFRPPLHDDMYAHLRGFPDEASLSRLERLGVTHVVVHTDRYERAIWEAAEARLPAFADRVSLVHVEGFGRVYRLSRTTR